MELNQRPYSSPALSLISVSPVLSHYDGWAGGVRLPADQSACQENLELFWTVGSIHIGSVSDGLR